MIKIIWESQFFYLFIFMILSMVLFFGTIKGLGREWSGRPDASHGRLIPIIVLFLIWRKNDEIKPLFTLKFSPQVLVISFFGLFFLFMERLSRLLVLQRLGVLVFLIGSVIFIIDKTAAKKYLSRWLILCL